MWTRRYSAIIVLLAVSLGVDCGVNPDSREALLRSSAREPRAFEDQVLEMIHSVMTNGLSGLGIPPLDPLSIDHLEVGHVVFQDLIELDYAVLDNVFSTKLNDFVANSLTLNVLQLGAQFNLTFPVINFEIAHYNISGILIKVVPFDGDGAIKATLNDLTIAGSITIGSREGTGYIYLRDLDLNVALEHLDLKITGLNGGGRLSYMAADIISADASQVVEQLQEVAAPLIKQVLLQLINDQMDSLQLTVGDLLNCLQSGDCFGSGQ